MLRISRGAAYELARQWRASAAGTACPWSLSVGPCASLAKRCADCSTSSRPGQRAVGPPGMTVATGPIVDRRRSGALRRTLGLTAWAALEELALDAGPQPSGRLAAAGECPGARRRVWVSARTPPPLPCAASHRPGWCGGPITVTPPGACSPARSMCSTPTASTSRGISRHAATPTRSQRRRVSSCGAATAASGRRCSTWRRWRHGDRARRVPHRTTDTANYASARPPRRRAPPNPERRSAEACEPAEPGRPSRDPSARTPSPRTGADIGTLRCREFGPPSAAARRLVGGGRC